MEEINEEFYNSPLLELHKEQEILTSTRLKLRPVELSDAPIMAELANNIKIHTMLANLPHPYSLHDAHDFINGILEGKYPAVVYAICNKKDDQFMGLCELKYDAKEIAVIGYWIGEPYWNKAYCTEAIRTLIDHCFEGSLVDQIHGNCRLINLASRRVLEKCCFRYLGEGLEYSTPGFGSQIVERYMLDRKTWTSLKQWK